MSCQGHTWIVAIRAGEKPSMMTEAALVPAVVYNNTVFDRTANQESWSLRIESYSEINKV